jgi:hypothetical protein
MLEIEVQTRDRHENADLAVKAFELSQNLVAKWDRADFDAKRRFLEIICLNLSLDGATLCPEWRKPFDLLAEGLPLEKSRGDWTPLELFIAGVGGWEARLRQRLNGGTTSAQ